LGISTDAHSTTLVNIVLEVIASAPAQKRKKRDTNWKGVRKTIFCIFFFANNMIMFIEIPKKLLELVSVAKSQDTRSIHKIKINCISIVKTNKIRKGFLLLFFAVQGF
jgi:hypothetical protein